MASEEPPNFCWCEDNVLCAMAFPAKKENLQYLVDNGVSILVTLTAERQVDPNFLKEVGLEDVQIPVRDYHPPTLEQAEQFVQLIMKMKSSKKACGVHCAGGLGRTGTMLCCYFVREHGMKPDEAIAFVRKKRPGSVETNEQEVLIHNYADFCKQGKNNNEAK